MGKLQNFSATHKPASQVETAPAPTPQPVTAEPVKPTKPAKPASQRKPAKRKATKRKAKTKAA